MTKQQKYTIFTIIGLIVVAAAILLIVRRGAPIQDQVSNGEEAGVVSEGNEEVVPGKTNGTTSTTAPVPGLNQTQIKYNTAITNARTAFANKEYDKAISYYNESLNYKDYSGSYAGLYTAYSAKGDWISALTALDKAIKLFPENADYWVWKIEAMDEQQNASFSDLTAIYKEALPKVSAETKVNLVTSFARVAEEHGKKTEAIGLWEYAQRLNVAGTAVYQAEIDRLKNM